MNMNQKTLKKKQQVIICKCNNIDLETINKAFENGCDSLNKLFDATGAGVGPCGGSCRKITGPMLETYLKNKTQKP